MEERQNSWLSAAAGRLGRRRLLLLSAAGAAASALQAACGSRGNAGSGQTRASNTSSTAGQPRPGGTVAAAMLMDPFDFDTTLLGKNLNNGEGVSLAYTPAIRFATGAGVAFTDLKLEAALADKWESPDDQTYTFHIRPGVQFANLAPVNGRALTSADVKFSWEYQSRTGQVASSKLPPAQNAWMFAGLSSIQTPDPQTVVAKFDQPYTPFLNYIAHTWNGILPHEIYDQYGKFSDHIAGTGAFQLDVGASQKGSRWVWKKNPTYWESGKPYLDQVTFVVVPDSSTQVAAFQTRQIDLISASDPQTRDQIQKGRPDAQLYEYLAPQPVHLYIEVQKPPLNDLRVRQAISLSLDRDEWVKTYAPGNGGWALAGAFPDTYTQAEIKGMLKTDLTQARQLLTAAGYSGAEIQILTPGNGYGDTYTQQAQLLQSQLKKGGLNHTIKDVEKADYLSRKQKHDFQLVFTGKALAPDVDSYLTVFEPGAVENYGGVDDPTLTNLIHAQRQEADAAKRKDIVRQAAKRINVDQVWALAIFYPTADAFWNPRLQDYRPNFGYFGWPLEHAWLTA